MKQIVQVDNFINKNESEMYINWINNNLDKFLFLDHRQRYMLRFGFDQEYPNDTHYDLNILGEIKDSIINLINDVIEEVKQDFNEDELYLGSFFISKHLPNSVVPLHSDGTKEFNQPLHYSALVYLNELEDSGGLFFNLRNILLHPKVGDLVVFETHNKTNMHSVPDVSGDRYSIPIWLTRDPDFNLLKDVHKPSQG